MSLFRRKDVSALQAEVAQDQSLKRALGPINLVTLGIGAIIGAGIFVLTGQAAANYAGPAIVYSFILAGLGIALVPRFTSGDVAPGMVLKPMRGVASVRQIVALVRPDVAERLAVRTVLDVLVARAARLEQAYGHPSRGGGGEAAA